MVQAGLADQEADFIAADSANDRIVNWTSFAVKAAAALARWDARFFYRLFHREHTGAVRAEPLVGIANFTRVATALAAIIDRR